MNGLHHMMEVPSIVRKIFWAAENGYDAVISSNTFDPGVDGGRLAVDIPVIGLLRTTLHAARRWPTGSASPCRSRRMCHICGACCARWAGAFRHRHQADRHLWQGHEGAQGGTLQRHRKLIRGLVDETGAEIILPLGGALIPYVVDPDDLASATGAQVLNTKAIGIRFAETCVDLSMTQSAITYPRAKLNYKDFTSKL